MNSRSDYTFGYGAADEVCDSWFSYVFTYTGPNHALLGFYNAIVLVLETGFAIVAFINLTLNLILPEEIEDEETPELTANEVDQDADQVEWDRIRKGKGSEEGDGEVSKVQ